MLGSSLKSVVITDVSAAQGLDFIAGKNEFGVIISGLVTIEDEEGERIYNWSASLKGNDPTQIENWQIDVYDYVGEIPESEIVKNIFDEILKAYQFNAIINNVSLKNAIDTYISHLKKFEVTQPELFNYFVDLGRDVLLKSRLGSEVYEKGEVDLMEVLLQIIPTLKEVIFKYFNEKGEDVSNLSEVELIEKISKEPDLINHIKGYIGSSLRSKFYSAKQSTPEISESSIVLPGEPFEDVHDWSEKIFSQAIGANDILPDSKEVIEDLSLAFETLEKEDLEKIAEKVMKMLSKSPNALTIFTKIMDILLYDFSEEDLQKLSEAGVTPDLYSQKTWSILTGIKDPVSVSDAFSKIREAIARVLSSAASLVDAKKVFDHTVKRNYSSLLRAKKIFSDRKKLDDFLNRFREVADSTEWNAFYDYIVEEEPPEDIAEYYNISLIDLANIIEKGLSYL